ncbi:helix-turn-helix domain-containing protein [Nocardia otitidiscaviarum]|uniref:helix-turn-helix domain-containing protein n=1 Tax=Nocardia otitidiscaviarum TaxID=1823 RepID=UPI002457EE47|nr:helix-turn-helix domain-containing protein [Nocardia otitidiscaviarum]
MSWQATQWAAKHVPPQLVSLPARAVLSVFAEAADETGRGSYPSLSTVAWYLDCTERNVAMHVKALVKAGLLIVSPNQAPAARIAADRRPVVYDLPIHWVRVDEKPEPKRRGRKRASVVDLPLDTSSRGEESFPNEAKNPSARNANEVKDSDKRGEENFANDRKDSSIRGEENFIQTTLEPPIEPPTEPLPHVSNASAGTRDANDSTDDHVHALCHRLHQHVLANGLTADPPAITRQWELAARALLQLDGRDPAKVLNLIDWCQHDGFWRAHILDMPTFRRKYSTLHAKATAQWQTRKAQNTNNIPVADQRIRELIEQGERLQRLVATENPTPPPALTNRGFFAPLRELDAPPPEIWEIPAA